MVQVRGTKGNIVQINIVGVTDVIRKITKSKIMISNATELALVQNGALLAGEVQESVIGNRSEPKSVDTGRFANSIEVSPLFLKNLTIFVQSLVPYAKILEFGSGRRPARKHFRNTLARMRVIILTNFKRATGKAVKIGFRL